VCVRGSVENPNRSSIKRSGGREHTHKFRCPLLKHVRPRTNERPCGRHPSGAEPNAGSGSCQSERVSTGNLDFMPLSQTGGKCESLTDISLFQIREIGEQLLDRATCRQRFYDHANCHAHSTDARFPTHHIGIDRDSLELLHVGMIAQFGSARRAPQLLKPMRKLGRKSFISGTTLGLRPRTKLEVRGGLTHEELPYRTH
jgi:hypothetical protein